MSGVKDNPVCKNDVSETIQFDLKAKGIDYIFKLNESINTFHTTGLSPSISTWN